MLPLEVRKYLYDIRQACELPQILPAARSRSTSHRTGLM
jgi:hypothetical protein